MKSAVKWVGVLAITWVLAACGGGGGSPGNTGTSGSGSSGTTDSGGTAGAVTSGSLTLSLVNGSGATVSANELPQTGEFFLRAVVRNAANTPVDQARVAFTLDDTNAVALNPQTGVARTSSDGIAEVKISPANVSASGVVTAKATAAVNGADVIETRPLVLLIRPGAVELGALTLTPSSVTVGQSLALSLPVTVNAQPASANSVSVSFQSSCGAVSPATAAVNSEGLVVAVLQTSQSGTCQVSASYGTRSVSQQVNVAAAPTTSIRFLSATPERIVQQGAPGVTQSTVKFRVVNSSNQGVASQQVRAELRNNDGGVTFCNSSQLAATNADGDVEFSVCSGTVPTAIQVRAILQANSSIYVDSNVLTVQTGLPTQRFFDLAVDQHNVHAGAGFTDTYSGNEVTLTANMADRLGNPVPVGTSVVFVTEGGLVVSDGLSSCTIGAEGGCSVQLRGQDYRPPGMSLGDPRPGRVTVLAHASGEESFTDLNGNNRWDAGEPFEDMGQIYLDKNEDGLFTSSYSGLVPASSEGDQELPMTDATGAAIGNVACAGVLNTGLSMANTCNARWDGFTKVRRSLVVIFSGAHIGDPDAYDDSIPERYRTEVLSVTAASALIRLADQNGNPLPAGSSVAVENLDGSRCAGTLTGQYGNTTEPRTFFIPLKDCASGDSMAISVTTTSGSSTIKSSLNFIIP